MEISAIMVKQLRDRTGAGIMDCKKVLVECDGDQEKAIEVLRKKGAEMADARSGRAASEGIIVCQLSESRDCGALVEVNCETDFVSRGDVFRDFALPLAKVALEIGEDCDDVNVLSAMKLGDSGQTVEEARLEILSKIRENIFIGHLMVFKAAEGSTIGSYVHRGRMGILAEVTGGTNGELEDDLAVHIAVKKPQWLDVSQIPKDILDKERDIYLGQARETGKPEHVLDRIVEGKLKKFSSESTLLNQEYYEDEDKTVGAVLQQYNASVNRFCLLELGT